MHKKLPIHSLSVSSKNVRTIVEDDPAFDANIEAVGVINPLVVERVAPGKYEIHAGQRRYRSVLRLIASGTSARFPDENATIDCEIRADEDAVEISLSENLHREAMHPIDEFIAFNRLVENGMPTEKIALRHGVTERYVLQRMKLARLSEKVLAALREGQIKMEMAEAMTVSGDHERQDNMLAALLSAPYSFNARSIRHHLMSEKIRASSSLGTFVLEWYRAEGLAETADLFGEEVWLDDAAAVERIGLTLLEEKVEALKADGWKWVRTALEYSCELFEGVEFSDPDIEAIDEDGKDDFSPGRRAECGCIVYLHHGTLFIEEGAVLNDVIEADQPVTEDGSGTMPANENVSNEGASAEAAPCYSRALVDTLSVHRTRALQLAISKDKSTALSLLLFNLHLGISGRSGIYHSPSNLRAAASHQFAPKAEEDCVNRAEDALKQAVGEVNIVDDGYLSSEQAIALFDSIHAMSDDEKLNAIILHTALSVDAPMAGGCLPRNGMAEHIGVLLGVDVTTAWRPDPDFLKRTSKRVIAESIPLGHGQEKLARMKKDNLVKTLSGWFARPEEVSAADLGYEEEIPAEVTDTLATWLPAGMAFKSTEPETPASDEAIPEGDAAEESIAA